MRELIEKQAAIDAHCELCVDRNKYFCNSDICPDVEVFQLIPSVQTDHFADADKKEIVEAIFHEKYEDVVDLLKRLLSALQEIIYCKDCKYCEHWYADKYRCFLWYEGGIDVFEDGFCNYAKRRQDG